MQNTWQQSISHAVKDVKTLLSLVGLEASDLNLQEQAHLSFKTLVPLEFVDRMERKNPNDPLLLQVLPQATETDVISGFLKDPLEENQQNPVPGLLHKYPSRVLLTLTGGCAVNCRYCFRRHFPYEKNMPSAHWEAILHYLQTHPEIDEVILSGGDPLLLKDSMIANYIRSIENIPHVIRLRIHTRLPIVIPSRVTDEMMGWINVSRLQMVMVLHTNHPNEIDQAVVNALTKLRQTKMTMLNQSVLLKSVNDDAQVLADLSKQLFAAGVMPYYLHLLDKVQGAAHFDVPLTRAHAIMQSLKEKLPGFLVPKLAREVSGKLSKQY